MKILKIVFTLALVGLFTYSCAESAEQESSTTDSTSVSYDTLSVDSISVDSTK
jgi:hypothetical protein